MQISLLNKISKIENQTKTSKLPFKCTKQYMLSHQLLDQDERLWCVHHVIKRLKPKWCTKLVLRHIWCVFFCVCYSKYIFQTKSEGKKIIFVNFVDFFHVLDVICAAYCLIASIHATMPYTHVQSAAHTLGLILDKHTN